MPSKKLLFDVDLYDSLTNRTLRRGVVEARGVTEAMRKFHKSLGSYNDQINYLERRKDNDRYERYLFLASKRR